MLFEITLRLIDVCVCSVEDLVACICSMLPDVHCELCVMLYAMLLYESLILLPDYDWESNEYSAWTESRWMGDAMKIQIFLVPDRNYEVIMRSWCRQGGGRGGVLTIVGVSTSLSLSA